MDLTTVKIGDRDVTIPEFSGFRALEIAGALADISDGVPEIQKGIADFTREYERDNVAEMERTFALFQFGAERLQGITEEDWQANGNMLRLPKSPTTQEIVWSVFPKAYRFARLELLRLAALFEASDQELEEWDEANDVDIGEKLLERGRAIAHESKGTQLLELIVAGAERVQTEFGDKIAEIGGRLGNVLRLFGWTPADTEAEIDTPEPAPTPDTPAEPVKPTAPPPATPEPTPTPQPEPALPTS